MTSFTDRLPVSLIPEQFFIAAMGDDVIDDCCGRQAVFAKALDAKRVSSQEERPRSPPSRVITALRGRFSGILLAMLFAIHAIRQVGAAGMPAGAPW